MSTHNQFPLNIAFIGPVSSGKSTLLNAILSDTYSDMKLRRTTMCPQVYTTSPYYQQEIRSTNDIRQSNTEINQTILDAREKGDKITLKETWYKIRPISSFYQQINGLYYNLYDIPGLNDQSSQIYFDYVKQHINKFDLIFLVFDINSGINRTDELGILEFILQELKNSSNHQTHLIVIANKCDAMYIDNQQPKFDDDEHSELYQQTGSTIGRIMKKIDTSLRTRVHLAPLSAETLYIYRNYQNDPNCCLDDRYLDKLAHNEIGKSQWNRRCKQFANEVGNDNSKLIKNKKMEFVRDILQKADISESISNTGFGIILNILTSNITSSYQMDLIFNKWSNYFKTIQPEDGLAYDTFYKMIENYNLINNIIPTFQPQITDHISKAIKRFITMRDEGDLISPIELISMIERVKPMIPIKIFNLIKDRSDEECNKYVNILLDQKLSCLVDFDRINQIIDSYPDIKNVILFYWIDKSFKVDYYYDSTQQLKFLNNLKKLFPSEFLDLVLNYYFDYIGSIKNQDVFQFERDRIMWARSAIQVKYNKSIRNLLNIKYASNVKQSSEYTEINNDVSEYLLSLYTSSDDKKSELQNQIDELKEQLNISNSRIDSLQIEIGDLKEQLNISNSRTNSLVDQLTSCHQKIEQLESNIVNDNIPDLESIE